MSKYYQYEQVILGAQSYVEGRPADYSQRLLGGNTWSYSGSTFRTTVRSDNEASDKFNGGYRQEYYNPLNAIGNPWEQSVTIDGERYAASFDYAFELVDEDTFTTYYVAVIDIDLDASLDFRTHDVGGQAALESGQYLIFVGDVPPPDKELKILVYAGPKKSHFDLGAQLVCFLEGTLIETESGCKPVEEIQPGTNVWTIDSGLQPVRWIGARHIERQDMQEQQRPVRIAAGALGTNMPDRDLFVSPQHRMLVISKLAERMFGQPEVLIAAKHLTGLPGVDVVAEAKSVSYWHFLFDRHQIVLANGALSESLYPGPQAMKAFSPAVRREICTVLPELSEANVQLECPPARLLIPGNRARNLVKRSLANRKPVIQHQIASTYFQQGLVQKPAKPTVREPLAVSSEGQSQENLNMTDIGKLGTGIPALVTG